MALEAQSLSLTLRRRMVLHDVSLTLPKGKITVIIGPNGAGKSSLLSCLSGLRNPDSGRVSYEGLVVTDMLPRERARRIGLLPQNRDIYWDVNVRALVSLGRIPHHDRWGASQSDETAIEAAMAQTDCLHLADRKAQQLSGGEQARVLLARVFAGEPDWILADEPLANLDPAHQLDTMNNLVRAAHSGKGVVVVLHDLTQAARIADHIIILKAGKLMASGSVETALTPDILQAAFDIAVHITQDAQGAAIVVPTQRLI